MHLRHHFPDLFLRWQALPHAWRRLCQGVIFVLLFFTILALAILYGLKRNENDRAAIHHLIVTTFQPTKVLPIMGSGLGVAEIYYGTYFSSSSEKPQTKVIYDGGDGKICIRTNMRNVWLDSIRCVEGANPKSGTPLTLCDWIGGPSGAFINTDNHLSMINYVPKNDTWILSSLAEQRITPHPKSELASIPWRNGTEIWIYYQDSDGQVREYGMDDYRDTSWRDGDDGPLGQAQEGSSFGISRYVSGEQEIEEIFFQSTDGAIHGRRYINSVWDPEYYSVNATGAGLPLGTRLTATTVAQADGEAVILLAYVSSSEFLTVQSRGTANVTNLRDFSSPQQVVKGDGRPDTSLAADGSSGVPRIYLLKDQRILLLESDVAMADWTTTDISS